MITSAKYINYIVETVNVLRQEIISKNKIGLVDDNKHIENFVCYLLNESFGYQLENLNERKSDYPGIDLGDSKNGLGIQVTSKRTSDMINSRLETIIKYKCYDKYPNIRFFITSYKQEKYTINVFDRELLNFDHKTDILDFDSFFIKSMYLDVGRQKKIAEYIHEQIPYITASIGGDYFSPNTVKRLVHEFQANDWVNGQLIIEHNFEYLPQVSVMDLEGSEVMVEIKRDEKFVKLGATLTFSGKALLS